MLKVTTVLLQLRNYLFSNLTGWLFVSLPIELHMYWKHDNMTKLDEKWHDDVLERKRWHLNRDTKSWQCFMCICVYILILKQMESIAKK